MVRVSDTTKAYVAERVGRASLLLPASDEESRKAVALIDRAVNADEFKVDAWALSYFQVAKGLAEYRQGHLDNAIALLKGIQALKPAPQLILAMAQQRLGKIDEAHKTLASALRMFDWSQARAIDADAWMFHVLRREAEATIQPSSSSLK